MKTQYVKELAEGALVGTTFVISSKELRCTRSGEAYLALEFADRTGRISGVWFRPAASGTAAPVGAVVRVEGRVTSFRGTKRVSVASMNPVTNFDDEDYLAGGVRDRSESVAAFKSVAATVREPELRRVLKAVFGDEVFFTRFASCPGAKSHHHAYMGGLIEHSGNVARICGDLAPLYEQVDRDLLVTAALMHDIGKVDELTWRSGIDYTDEGRLLGHVVLGERRMREAVARLRRPVPAAMLTKLSHAMLSHHGELEWGAPKRPSTLEAMLLHHVDNLDAKAAGFLEIVAGASAAEERWTDAQNLFRRPLYAPLSAQDEGVDRAEVAADLVG